VLCNYSIVQLRRLVVFVLGVRHEGVHIGLDEAGQSVKCCATTALCNKKGLLFPFWVCGTRVSRLDWMKQGKL